MMRRTPMKPGTKPLKRTGFAPKAKPVAGLLRTANLGKSAFQAPSTVKPAKPLKARKSQRPKMTKIRASARDQECTLRFPGICNQRTDTTVLCHSNQLKDGKGMGLKAPDTKAAYGCSACHDVLDGRARRPDWMARLDMLARFEEGQRITMNLLARKGLIETEE